MSGPSRSPTARKLSVERPCAALGWRCRHKGLATLFEAGNARRVQPQHTKRLNLIVTALNAATQAAAALGVSRKHVSAIVNGRVPVSPDIWINLQAQYDLWQVRQQALPRVKRLAAGLAGSISRNAQSV